MNRSLRGIGRRVAGFLPVVLTLTLTLTLTLVAVSAATAQTSGLTSSAYILAPEEIVHQFTFSDLGLDPNSTITAIAGGDFATVTLVPGGISYRPAGDFWAVGFDSLTISSTNGPGSGVDHTRLLVEAGSRREFLFLDEFETASANRQIGGDVTKAAITAAAALNGLMGLEVTVEAGNSVSAFIDYSMDLMPGNPKGDPDDGGLDVKMDPNAPPPVNDDLLPFSLVQAAQPLGSASIPGLAEPRSFDIELQATVTAGYQVRAVAYDRNGAHETAWYSITDAPHKLSLDWWSEEEDNGILLRIDDRFAGKLNGLRDPLVVDLIRIGAMELNNPPAMQLYFDDLQIWGGNLVAERQIFFADQFDGDVTWTSSFLGGGLLTYSSSAALAGGSGLDVSLQATSHVFLQSETPAAEDLITDRFMLDPNSIDLGTDDVAVFTAYGQETPAGDLQLQVRIKKSGSVYRVVLDIWDDDGHRASNWTDLIDGPQSLTVQWWNANALRGDKGRARLWVDSTEVAEIDQVKTGSTQIEVVRFGALGIDGPTGSIFLDEFEIWR